MASKAHAPATPKAHTNPLKGQARPRASHMQPSKTFYESYWSDPDHAEPARDPDADVRCMLAKRFILLEPTNKVLDVGCGRGAFSAELAHAGSQVVGMDIADSIVRIAKQEHPTVTFLSHPVEQLPWPFDEGEFDAVVSLEVIEHLLDVRPLLRGSYQALRPGGRLLLSTPYHGLLKSLAICLFGFEEHFCNLRSGHIRFYTAPFLARLVKDSGFQVECVHYYGRRWPFSSGMLLVGRKSV